MKVNLPTALLGLAISSSAFAQGAAYGAVVDVTAETMPSSVAFTISGSPCGGNYFSYSSGDQQNNKAVYFLLLEAVANNGSVWVQYDSGCRATAVHGVQVPEKDKSISDRRRLLRRVARRVVEMLVLGL